MFEKTHSYKFSFNYPSLVYILITQKPRQDALPNKGAGDPAVQERREVPEAAAGGGVKR